MTPIARLLAHREMQDVSAWYANQPPGDGDRAAAADVRQRQLGGAISAVGVPERGVTACTSCHGRLGEGVAPSVPALAGQFAPYTALQLRLWKRGERRNDPLGVMAQVARGMTDEEIDAVAAYFAALDPKAAQEAGGPARAAR
jgi:cytochrome c553